MRGTLHHERAIGQTRLGGSLGRFRASCTMPLAESSKRSRRGSARPGRAERASCRVRAPDQAMEHQLNAVLALGAARFPARRARRLRSSPISAARTLRRTEVCVRRRGQSCRLYVSKSAHCRLPGVAGLVTVARRLDAAAGYNPSINSKHRLPQKRSK